MYNRLIYIQFVFIILYQCCESSSQDNPSGSIRVNKCCEPNEILVDLRCTDVNETSAGNVFFMFKFQI